MSCQDFAPNAGFVRGLLAQADCHANALGVGGFHAIGGPSGLAAGLVGGVLTLYVGLQGWRLLTGGSVHLGTWTTLLVRIGFVLAFTSQWTVFQTLVFGPAVAGPQQIAAAVLDGYSQEIGADIPDVGALQRAYDRLSAAGRTNAAEAANSQPVPNTVPAPTAGLAPNGGLVQGAGLSQPPPPPGAEAGAPPQDKGGGFRAAALLLMLATVGMIVPAKLLLAAMLAIGPLALLAAQFDQTRGVTVGWARALLATALLLLLANVLTPLELNLLQPALRRIAAADPAERAAADAGPALVVTSVFALAAVLCTAVAALFASALRFASRPRDAGAATESRTLAPGVTPAAKAQEQANLRPSGAAPTSTRTALAREDRARYHPMAGMLAAPAPIHGGGTGPSASLSTFNAGGKRRSGLVARTQAASRRDQ